MHASAERLHAVDLARVGWGLLLLTAPGRVVRLAGVRPSSPHLLVARVLGLRHLVQAVVLRLGGSRMRHGGAVVDAAHAASAIALARSGRAPLAWGCDAAIATGFAASTWRTTPGR